jgi:excisionase family DNA binding protein
MAGRTLTDWITYKLAQQLLGGISYLAFSRLIEDGRLSVCRVPGTLPRVRRSEVEELAASFIQPARTPVGDARVDEQPSGRAQVGD